jgi:predicted DNA binding CopG/RHH family protein
MEQSKFELDETELLTSYEQSEWQSVNRLQDEIRRYQAFAQAVVGDKKLVSVALPASDFEAVQQKARAEGVASDTYIANIVHEFVMSDAKAKS